MPELIPREEPSPGLDSSPMPTFQVLQLEDGDALVTCPKVRERCGNGAIVDYKAWVNASKYKTRSCTYCSRTSKIPPMEITKSADL